MPQKLTIHVGYPKTGTTTLQNSCFANLPEDVYLGKSHGRMVGWLDRFRDLINYGTETHVRTYSDELATNLSNYGQDLVISLEGLTNPFVDTSYLHPKDVYLKAQHIQIALAPSILNGLDVKILMTVRDQVDLIPSLFAQVGFHGAAAGLFEFDYDSFLDFLFEDDVTGFGSNFCFDLYADHCATLFGPDAITVLKMSDLVHKRAPAALDALAQIIPLSMDAIADALDTPAQNVRRSSKGSDYKMMIGSPIARQRLIASPEISWIDKAKVATGRSVRKSFADRSQRISTYYLAANERLAKIYGISF